MGRIKIVTKGGERKMKITGFKLKQHPFIKECFRI
jgi:hypothetical protein